MVNISLEELLKQFERKEVNVAQVNADDGRSFSVSVSLKISEHPSKQSVESKKQSNTRSPVECDTSGCMNSSPDSDRSGTLNPNEFVDNGTCNVDDFLNNFDDPTFVVESQSTVAAINNDIVDEDECDSNADSDCNPVNVEYFVLDKLVGKRFNDKTQKFEFLMRPKRYTPENEIIWNPIDNQDDFDVSLLEHSRLYFEVPDALKLEKKEERKRSVLQDKFLSEVNILPATDPFDKEYPSDIPGSNDATMDIDVGTIPSSFDELDPFIDPVHGSQSTESIALQNPEQLLLKQRKPAKSSSNKTVYYCAHCEYQVSTKRSLMKHVREHIVINRVSRNCRRKKKVSSPVAKVASQIQSREKESQSNVHTKPLNGLTHVKKGRSKKPKPAETSVNLITAALEKEQTENESDEKRGENVSENCDRFVDGEGDKITEAVPYQVPVDINENFKGLKEDVAKNREKCVGSESAAVLTFENNDEPSQNLNPSETKVKLKNKRTKIRSKVVRIKAPEKLPQSLEMLDQTNDQQAIKKVQKRSSSEIECEEDRNTQDSLSKRCKETELGSEVSHEISRSENCEKLLNDDAMSNSEDTLTTTTRKKRRSNNRASKLSKSKLSPISVRVTIPLSKLENSNIDIEKLKRTKRVGKKKGNSAECGSFQITEVELTSETLPNEETEYSLSELSTVALASTSACDEVSENVSIRSSDRDATDQEIISNVVDEMIVSLDPESAKSRRNPITVENSTKFHVAKKNVEICDDSAPTNDQSRDTGTPSVSRSVSEKRYQCPYCIFSDLSFGTYKEHVRQEHADKFIQCSFCSRHFMSKSSKRRHENDKHAALLPNVCIKRLDLSDLPNIIAAALTQKVPF